MGVLRFDPFREMERLQSDINRVFEERNAPNRPWAPAVDVLETETELVVRAELPGLKQEDIDIELTGDTLTLRGERTLQSEEKRENYVRVERAYGRFQRSFTVAAPIQHDQVSASYRDGILEVRLPKSEANRPRKVPVVAP